MRYRLIVVKANNYLTTLLARLVLISDTNLTRGRGCGVTRMLTTERGDHANNAEAAGDVLRCGLLAGSGPADSGCPLSRRRAARGYCVRRAVPRGRLQRGDRK